MSSDDSGLITAHNENRWEGGFLFISSETEILLNIQKFQIFQFPILFSSNSGF